MRSESFSDHYSQARQFFVSQTPLEQRHMVNALVFELSKVESSEIRIRMVSHLLNIHKDLAQNVADGLGLREMPEAADAAKPPKTDLKKSPALSILLNSPKSFRGRKLGVLITDQVDHTVFQALQSAVNKERATLEVIAPKIGEVTAANGSLIEVQQTVEGAPSVLYDAVALLPSEDGAKTLANMRSARDFVADAFVHMKFIGYVHAAAPLLDIADINNDRDGGIIALNGRKSALQFLESCRQLRFWDRTESTKG
ncbi:MAG: catalase-related domain-containing protein [Nitrospirales bacterium]